MFLTVVFALLLFPICQCAEIKFSKNESNLVDLEISNALHRLFANFDKIDKHISIENGTISDTTTKSTTITTTQQKMECGASVKALTTIEFNSPFMHLQYWLLKPKLHLLRTVTKTSINEFGSYREVVTQKNQHMIISYEFSEPKKINCEKLVEFSKSIVSYGRGEIPKIIVKCDCDKTFYLKRA